MENEFQKIKNIIFDLGNVIINIDFALTDAAFSKLSSKDLNEVKLIFEKEQIWDKYEKGFLSDQEFIDLLRKSLEINVSDQEIINAWNALLLDFPIKRIEKIKELSLNYRLFILSNTSAIHIRKVNEILKDQTAVGDLKDLVEKVYYSYEIGMRKPSAEIYEFVLKDSFLLAEETLFLDDNWDNIIGARAVGIKSLHVFEKDMCEMLP